MCVWELAGVCCHSFVGCVQMLRRNLMTGGILCSSLVVIPSLSGALSAYCTIAFSSIFLNVSEDVYIPPLRYTRYSMKGSYVIYSLF